MGADNHTTVQVDGAAETHSVEELVDVLADADGAIGPVGTTDQEHDVLFRLAGDTHARDVLPEWATIAGVHRDSASLTWVWANVDE